eukprot:613895-Rhodomonas_salina.1
MPAATAPTTQTSILTSLPMSSGAQGIASPPTPVSQKTPVPPPALPSMPAGGLEPLSFSGPANPAELATVPQPNAELRAAMNG